MILVLLLPALVVIAVAVRVSSSGRVLFRQERVGRGGRLFQLVKFRTMTAGSRGAGVTAAGDERITPVGRILRKTKLDELPEFWNVLRGDMSLVGPRPEVPQFVDLSHESWRQVLEMRPGISDPVTITLRDEEKIIAAAGQDPERFYRTVLQPWKLRGYLRYRERRTCWSDVGILFQSVWAIVYSRHARPPTREELEADVTRAENDRLPAGTHPPKMAD